MTASGAWRRADGLLPAALVVAMIGVCSSPVWWTIGAFFLAGAACMFEWRRAIGQRDGARGEAVRLKARIREFASMQGLLVGNIAHEIKTPLSVVIGETEVLALRCEDPAAVRGIAASMASELRHLSDLVESFLELAHPFVQEDTATHVPVFVGDCVIAAVARCNQLSKKLGVGVVTVFGKPDNGDPTAEVLGDSLLLEVMIENLLRNALRFSPAGSQVELTTHSEADKVGILVRDHGVGIPTEQQEAVFDWFFEGPGRPTKTMGTGFGLAIAKRVVDHHQGTITLRNTSEGGCEFQVLLPRFWPPDALLEAVDEGPGAATAVPAP